MSNTGSKFRTDWLRTINFGDTEVQDAVSDLERLNESELSKATVIKLIGFLDLTSLKATDTPTSIARLLDSAKTIKKSFNCEVAGVCVYQPFILQCKESLHRSKVKVVTVSGGFPSGQMDVSVKTSDLEHSVKLGADEIDLVISRALVFQENWTGLYDEVSICKKAAGKHIKLKVIIGTGDLEHGHLIAKASFVCMMAGADFIKTSTGYEQVNATLYAGIIMAKAIKKYYHFTGIRVGLKPAGGIKNALESYAWYKLVETELGEAWLTKDLFRIGASSLLSDLTGRLEAM